MSSSHDGTCLLFRTCCFRSWRAVSCMDWGSLWGLTWLWSAALERLPRWVCCTEWTAFSWSPIHARHWYCHYILQSTHTRMVQWHPAGNGCRILLWCSSASFHLLEENIAEVSKKNSVDLQWRIIAVSSLYSNNSAFLIHWTLPSRRKRTVRQQTCGLKHAQVIQIGSF